LECSFGLAPGALDVLPINRVLAPTPAATIMDFIPLVNILPFGMCTSPATPEVIAATAAALGVPTPMPCIPVTVDPWLPGSPDVLIGAFPALNDESLCMCAWGGVIAIIFPGEVTVEIP